MHWQSVVLSHQVKIQSHRDRANSNFSNSRIRQKYFFFLGVTALSGWVLVCLLFVFAALSSYATLLYRKYYKSATSGLLSFNLVSSLNTFS
jgi:hypothetical protein